MIFNRSSGEFADIMELNYFLPVGLESDVNNRKIVATNKLAAESIHSPIMKILSVVEKLLTRATSFFDWFGMLTALIPICSNHPQVHCAILVPIYWAAAGRDGCCLFRQIPVHLMFRKNHKEMQWMAAKRGEARLDPRTDRSPRQAGRPLATNLNRDHQILSVTFTRFMIIDGAGTRSQQVKCSWIQSYRDIIVAKRRHRQYWHPDPLGESVQMELKSWKTLLKDQQLRIKGGAVTHWFRLYPLSVFPLTVLDPEIMFFVLPSTYFGFFLSICTSIFSNGLNCVQTRC